MARKDDAQDAENAKDTTTSRASGKAASGTEPTTSKGTAPKSLDDLDMGTTGTESADSDSTTSTSKSAASKASAAKAGTSTSAASKKTADTEADATAGLDEVPFELAEDRPNPEDLPETGLVSEFVDVGRRQASWLVSNRESSTVMRSPFFLVTVAVVILGILAVIISGIVREAQVDSGTPSMAMVGVGEQAAMYEQQLGVKITDVADAQAAEQLVRDGEVDAAFIQDPTGQTQPTIIALDKQPTALLEKLAPQTEATLLQTPAVAEDIATPLLWGMVVFSLLVIGTLGTALYQNLRLEKRNRITEIIAATIPPRAAASGRITGMLTLVVIHLLVAAVVLELGLSISGRTSIAFAMLPGLGWFALTLFFTAWAIFALLVWASTLTSDRARSIVLTIIGILTVGGAMAPVIVGASGTVGRVLSWTPFTSPLGIAGRFFSAQPEWWEGLVAAAIAAVLALILHAVAGGAYVRSVLSGGGRGGKTVKMSKRAKKVAAASDSEEDADAKASTASAKGAAKTATATKDADADADSDDADADEVVTVSETEEVTTTKTAGATKAAGTTASAKGTRTTKATDDAMDSGKDSDAK
ncbi:MULTISPECIES: ABC transporter permease [Brevibacterium]|uniref:ABC-type Na+ efflux pump, permease component n=2 Tax=Brevibacterium casei TaxID=33889 RepID=K9AKS3_9MICO|nr:ABC transporter permease [Brevibacterium casei]NJE67581.1 sodium ABC transporter permease [Brevibacterium sp. LS14]EKU46681.1 ABC-type Na+ efflux pump, permease component [Brevibacterium casei S18]KZE21648.1 sodium ABC transporter permease [Brevibacterium casei]MCT1445931.1 ABC transporter permease [Brevibacterium casei]MCT2182961.1 ABC transporter permease [Brevibacterium casei]